MADLAVFGAAQPTHAGIATILTLLGCHASSPSGNSGGLDPSNRLNKDPSDQSNPSDSKGPSNPNTNKDSSNHKDPSGSSMALWVSSREEPLVFINGRPFVARDAAAPTRCSRAYLGISPARLEQAEARLAHDVRQEEQRCGGLVLVHEESSPTSSNATTVFPSWLAVFHLQTPRQLFDALASADASATFRVRYLRIPISPEQAPEDKYIDEYVRAICAARSDDPLVFVCGMGIGRSTFAMVIAMLVRRAIAIRSGAPDPLLSSPQLLSSSLSSSLDNIEFPDSSNSLNPLNLSAPHKLHLHSNSNTNRNSSNGPFHHSIPSFSNSSFADPISASHRSLNDPIESVGLIDAHNRAILRLVYVLDKALAGTSSGSHSAIEWIMARGALLDDLKNAVIGNYQCIQQLMSVLADGPAAKRALDAAIDRCDVLYNLRESILEHRVRYSATTDLIHLDRAFGCLERYFFLLAFCSYISEQLHHPDHHFHPESSSTSSFHPSTTSPTMQPASPHPSSLSSSSAPSSSSSSLPPLPPPSQSQHPPQPTQSVPPNSTTPRITFSNWLRSRPEIWNMLESLRQDANTLTPFRPIEDLSLFSQGMTPSAAQLTAASAASAAAAASLSSAIPNSLTRGVPSNTSSSDLGIQSSSPQLHLVGWGPTQRPAVTEIDKHVIKSRRGVVLGPHTILKEDVWTKGEIETGESNDDDGGDPIASTTPGLVNNVIGEAGASGLGKNVGTATSRDDATSSLPRAAPRTILKGNMASTVVSDDVGVTSANGGGSNSNGVIPSSISIHTGGGTTSNTRTPNFQVQGAINFRQIPGYPLYAVAQPTVQGVKNVLASLRTPATRVLWINLREEPLIYINSVPYVLRDQYLTLRNTKSYSGITSSRLESIEAKLKHDVIDELKRYRGRILLHTETSTGIVHPVWEDCCAESVLTPAEAMQLLRDEEIENIRSGIESMMSHAHHGHHGHHGSSHGHSHASGSKHHHDRDRPLIHSGSDIDDSFGQKSASRRVHGHVNPSMRSHSVVTQPSPLHHGTVPSSPTFRVHAEPDDVDTVHTGVSVTVSGVTADPMRRQTVHDTGIDTDESSGDDAVSISHAPATGTRISYFRVPTTAETPPDASDLDLILHTISRHDLTSTAIVINCQVGLGRSTVGAVVISLVLSWLGIGPGVKAGVTSAARPAFEPVVVGGDGVGGGNAGGISNSDGLVQQPHLRTGALPSATTATSPSVASPTQRPRLNYRSIHSLLRVIHNGLESKRVVDEAIDNCSHHINIRDSIDVCRQLAETESDPTQRRAHIRRGLLHLKRYFTLILFQNYLDHNEPGVEGMLITFQSWLGSRPEFATIREELETDTGEISPLVPVEDLAPGDGIALSSEVVDVVNRRSGAVLARGTIIKHDLFPGAQKLSLPDRIDGAHNFRKVRLADVRAVVRRPLVDVGDVLRRGVALSSPTLDAGLRAAEEVSATVVNHVDGSIGRSQRPSHSLIALHQTQATTDTLAMPNAMLYGAGMPTKEGIRRLINHVNAGPKGDRTLYWTSLREEPVIYINGRPYVLRLFQDPLKNLEATGIARERVESMETQMRRDILKDLRRYNGRLLLHEEHVQGTQFSIVPVWETVREEDVETPSDVVARFRQDGYRVDYMRIPITDEQAPIPDVFDQLMDRLLSVRSDGDVLFNCQMGRGRTTTGMVTTCLMQMIVGHCELLVDHAYLIDDDHGVDEDGYGGVDGSNHIGAGGGYAMFARDSEVDLHTRYRSGEYKIILQLVAVLQHGKLAKRLTDKAIDLAEHMQNLRIAIYDYRLRVIAADVGSRKHAALLEVALNYLVRYFFLITFADYLVEVWATWVPHVDVDGVSHVDRASMASIDPVDATRTAWHNANSANTSIDAIVPVSHGHSHDDADLQPAMSTSSVVPKRPVRFSVWLAERKEILNIIRKSNQTLD